MPRYRYQAKRGPGETHAGVLDGENEHAVAARLRDMGFIPIVIEHCPDDKSEHRLQSVFARIRLKDKNLFFRQLANLFESGMPLVRALNTLEAQTRNPKMRAMIAQLRDDIQQGASFAEALERQSPIFSPVQCSLVRAGETGGMLDEVLWRIVDFGEREDDVRGKALAAMTYPAFLLVAATVALFILVTFVFPKFTKVFEDFDVNLPWITWVVMSICRFMEQFWWLVLLTIALCAAIAVRFIRSENGKKLFDARILTIPVIGTVVHRYQMAQFARVFGTLLDNGVPVLSALEITASTLSNKAISEEVLRIRELVSKGESIHDALQLCRHFPPMVISMFAVGEESGRLGAVTKRMADAYDNEVDRAVRTLTALLEPTMILVIGSVVGILVIAMLLPMLTLSANVS